MKIGIVILNYKTYEMTISLAKQLHEKVNIDDTEIIVVDNNSPNDSSEKLAEYAAQGLYIFIRNDINAGYASGNNIGIKYAVNHGAEFILVVNNDIIISSEDVIDRMIKLMDYNSQIAAVSPRIVDAQGKHDPPIYFKRPNFYDLTIGMVAFQRERFKFNEYTNCKIYAPRGSCMLLRASAMKSIDYLDENTFLYYEEPILSERLDEKHYECWHCGEAEVIHNHAVTISSSFSKRKIAKNVCTSYSYYLKKYRKYKKLTRLVCVIVRYLAIVIRR